MPLSGSAPNPASPSSGSGPAPTATNRDALLWPFSQDSPWNLPIGSSAVYVPAGIRRATSMGMQPDVDILILTPNAPMTPVYYNSDAWDIIPGRCNAQGGVLFTAPIPSNFVVLGNGMGSRHGNTPNYATAILQSDGVTLIQGQPFAHCSVGGTATMWWFQTKERIDGLGLSGAHGGSMLSSIGGTIRLGELVPGGTIRHALKLNIDGVNYYGGLGAYRWPASTKDSCAPGCYTGSVPAMRIGSLLALPPNFDYSTLETEPARIIAHAFQDYGGYAADNAAWSVYGIDTEFSPSGDVVQEFASAWGYQIDPSSKDVPWSRDLDRIFLNLNVVDNWNQAIWQTVSASNGVLGAGLGAARVPWAPPIGGVVPPPPPPPPPPPGQTQTALTLTTSKNPSLVGERITVSGRLTTSTGSGIPNMPVVLEWSWDQVAWSRESQIGQFNLTDASGGFSASMVFNGIADHTEYLRAQFAGATGYTSSTSPVVAQDVRLGAPPPPPPPTPDTTPPVSTAALSGSSGAANWYTSSVAVTVSATDAQSGIGAINVRKDGGAWQAYTTPVAVAGDGTHTVDYYATDVAGNVESTRTISLKIDSVSPASLSQVTGTLAGDGTYVSPVTVTLSATDATSGLRSIGYSIDSGAQWTYASSFPLAGAGTYRLDYLATDQAGNVEGVHTLTIPLSAGGVGIHAPPVTILSAGGTMGANGWYNSNVDVTLSASGSNGISTRVAYRLDGGLWSLYTGPFTVRDGRHTLEYQASDADGYLEALHSATINVDSTPPTIVKAADVIAPDGSLSWTGSDSVSGIVRYEISVDGGPFQSMGTSTSLSGPWTLGAHTATVRAWDDAGNQGTASIPFRVDSSAAPPGGPGSPFIGPFDAGPPGSLYLAIGFSLVGVGLLLLNRQKMELRERAFVSRRSRA